MHFSQKFFVVLATRNSLKSIKYEKKVKASLRKNRKKVVKTILLLLKSK